MIGFIAIYSKNKFSRTCPRVCITSWAPSTAYELPNFAFQPRTQPFVVSRVVANIAAKKKKSKRQVNEKMKSQQWPNMTGDYPHSLWSRYNMARVNLRRCLKCKRSNAIHNASKVTYRRTQRCKAATKSFMYMTFDMMSGLGKRPCSLQPCNYSMLTSRGA